MTPPRISKSAAERRDDILDAAQRLFTTKGVQATSVEDILQDVGIAKGTLYYHFRSKDEILQGIITRTTKRVAAKARQVADRPDPVITRFLGVLAAMRVDAPELALAETLHEPGNAEFHVLSIVEMVRAITPILSEVVEQGVAEGTFSTEHPQDMVEILLTSMGMLLDDGIFGGEADQLPRRTAALISAAETLLGCRPGVLATAAHDMDAAGVTGGAR